ncbi:MAG TPA: lipopolysaccharide biosynthesis protein, partial [Abditibacteriaceae bacterium]
MKFRRTGTVPPNSDVHFKTDHLRAGIGARTIRGGAVTLSAQLLKLVLTTASMVILARLLRPNDYGLIGMASVTVGLVGIFKDIGLSAAIVQKPEITHEEVSTLFWVNIGVSVCLTLITCALAPGIALFYHEPRLLPVIMALAGAFIFTGLNVQHQALLSRQMRFTSLAKIDIAALGIGVLVAIVMAKSGAGYWAIVCQQLAAALTSTTGAWWTCHWRPGRPSKMSSVRSMLAFGGNLTGYQFANYFARNADTILIGRYCGTEQLGLYTRAYSLLMLPLNQINGPITAVAIPALSRLVDNPEHYRRAYLRTLEKIMMLTMPIAALMLMASDWIIALLLGPKWVESSIIFAWLSIGAFTQPIGNTTGWLYQTQNRTRSMLHWGIIAGVLTVVSIVVGLPYGPVWVAASYSVSGLIIRTPL